MSIDEDTPSTVAAASTTPASNAPAPQALVESDSSSASSSPTAVSPSIAPLAEGAAASHKVSSFMFGAVAIAVGLF